MSGPTREDAELFGDDLIAFAQRAATPVVNAHVGRLENQIGQLQTELAQERVQRALDADPALGRRWRQVNEDPRFLNWLDQVDELTGEKRVVLLGRAYRLGAAARCANFFKAFIMERIPANSRTQHREPFEEGGRWKPTITTRDLTHRRMWRRDEITRFYDDCRRGVYREREPERGRIEAEIIAAGREGRVLNPLVKMADEK